MTDLDGKVALVTGAGRGIGAAAARALAQAGARVLVSARRSADAEAVAARIGADGGTAEPFGCDVADPAAVAGLARKCKDRFGRLDLVVNNAGIIGPIGHLADTDPAAWAHTLQVNLTGAYHVVRETLPLLLEQGGSIVNISSGAAVRPKEGWSAYCASKAGLAMLTQMIHLEYGARGIRVIGFAPGLVDTDMQGTIRASGMNPISQLPRSALRPAEEPARMIVWLCGPQGAAHAGHEIDIREPALRAAAGLPAIE